MHLSTVFTLAVTLMTGVALADLHQVAVCVTDRKKNAAGKPTHYQISTSGTKCACDHYRNRNRWNPSPMKQWDKCPDCHFDGMQCNSPAWHIGGDEFEYYCRVKCGTQGSEAS